MSEVAVLTGLRQIHELIERWDEDNGYTLPVAVTVVSLPADF